MISNYDDLRAAVASWLDRDDLNGRVEDFIQLAEARFKRDIRIREMLVREPLIVYARQIELPEGILETLSLRLMTNPVRVLAELSFHDMERYRRDINGIPRFFSLRGNEVEFDVVPETAIEAEIMYYKALEPLSGDNPSNALLESSPDVYLYGALSASAPFLMNDERIPVWESFYAGAVEGLRKLNHSSRRVGPLVSRVAGATP